MSAMMPVTLLSWKPLVKNTLRGFVNVRLGRSLIMKELSCHEANGRRWVGLPARPMIDASGQVKKDDRGKQQYVSILEWSDRDAAGRFSEAVISALEAQYPDAFAVSGR